MADFIVSEMAADHGHEPKTCPRCGGVSKRFDVRRSWGAGSVRYALELRECQLCDWLWVTDVAPLTLRRLRSVDDG